MDQMLDLSTIRFGLHSNQVTPEEVAKYMHTQEVRGEIARFTSQLYDSDDAILKEEDIQKL